MYDMLFMQGHGRDHNANEQDDVKNLKWLCHLKLSGCVVGGFSRASDFILQGSLHEMKEAARKTVNT